VRSSVLLLVFNRPDATARVLDAIRIARPSKLYITADGPRIDRPDDVERCMKTRRACTMIDWPCEVITQFSEVNLGCRGAVTRGISWFLSNESEGIILEDDCLPDHSFFVYCDELLERYRASPRIMAVCGSNYGRFARGNQCNSYTFARPFDPWGWATWRRAWSQYDKNLDGLSRQDLNKVLRASGPQALRCEHYWRPIFAATRAGLIDTWDYQWTFSIFQQQGLVVYPRDNLISNIGYAQDATHTTEADSAIADQSRAALIFPLVHPSSIRADELYERLLYRRRFNYDLQTMLYILKEQFLARIRSIVPKAVKSYLRSVFGQTRD
jgi:hypothetical protein